MGKRVGRTAGEERVLAPLIMTDCTQGLTHAQTEWANHVIIIDIAVHDAAEEGQHECLNAVIATDGMATHCRTTTI